MDLRPYVDNLRQQLAVAAEGGGDDARALAERLVAPMDAAVRLTLQDVLAAAAEEITCELAPGAVELRLRGRDPEFVVTPPPAAHSDDRAGDVGDPPGGRPAPGWAMAAAGDEGEMTRINLRLPDRLKLRVEEAARQDGLSVNAWLVRAAAAALAQPAAASPDDRRPLQGAQRYRGWAR